MSEKLEHTETGRMAGAGWLRRLQSHAAGPKPIGFFLFLLIMATILPAIAVSVVLLQRNNQAQREVVNTLAEATAGSIADAVDRELTGMATTLRVLSTTPSLANNQLEDFHARARAALAGTGSDLILLDEHARPLIDTRVNFGAIPEGPVDLETGKLVLRRRGTVVSGVFADSVSGEWSFNVLAPDVPRDGPARILVLTRSAETLSEALSQQMLRGGWNASLIDQNGTVIASSLMSSDIGKPFFIDLESGELRERDDVREQLAPGPYIALADESRYSGWKTVVWASRAVIEAPMRRSLWTLLLGGLLVIAIGALAAWLLGRQIVGPVRRLARDAHRLGVGEPVQAVKHPIAEVATVSTALAEASLDREAAENEIRLLMREVAHRSKNQLTVVASLAKQTARHARSFAGFQDSFQKRLHGLARSTDLLLAGGAAGVELSALLVAQIEPFKPDDPKRLEIEGPVFRLANQPAQTLGLAIHELATNASKYGAFAFEKGRLEVSWSVRKDQLVLVWRERVPRLRRRPRRTGFGTEIIERMVGGTLDAKIARIFHSDGLECVFTIRASRLRPEIRRDDLPDGG